MENINYKDLTIDEINAIMTDAKAELKARKDNAKTLSAEQKEAAKAEQAIAGKALIDQLGEGATVTVTLKGENIEGTIKKIRDKTFDIEINDKIIWRYYYQVITENDTNDTEDDAA